MEINAFLATTLLGRVGDDELNPKPNKKLSSEAESYVTITWKGFFTQSQVLLPSLHFGYNGDMSFSYRTTKSLDKFQTTAITSDIHKLKIGH